MNLGGSQTFRPQQQDSRLETREESQFKYEGSLLAEFPTPQGKSVFFLRPSANWMRPFRIIIMEGNPLYSESTDLNVNAKQKNICTEASRIMFGQISACRGLAKLTHKINHLAHTRVCSLNLPSLLVAQEFLLIGSFLALLLSLSWLHVSTL